MNANAVSLTFHVEDLEPERQELELWEYRPDLEERAKLLVLQAWEIIVRFPDASKAGGKQ